MQTNKSRILIVAGSPGAGKTTILGNAAVSSKYKVVNVGSIMKDMAVSEGYIKDRDELRHLPYDVHERIGIKAFKKIAKIKGTIILDTHASVEKDGRFVMGLNDSKVTELNNIAALAYIDATNEEIIQRRKHDKSRSRERESAEWLNRQRMVDMSVLSYYSAALNIPLYVIDNRQSMEKQALSRFLMHAKEVFGGK